jgi:hypothetical protein
LTPPTDSLNHEKAKNVAGKKNTRKKKGVENLRLHRNPLSSKGAREKGLRLPMD